MKTRSALAYVEGILRSVDLRKAPNMRYDPHGILSRIRVNMRLSTYNHEKYEILEKVANLETWEQVRQALPEGYSQQLALTTIVATQSENKRTTNEAGSSTEHPSSKKTKLVYAQRRKVS